MNTIFKQLVNHYVESFIRDICDSFHSSPEDVRIEMMNQTFLVDYWKKVFKTDVPALLSIDDVDVKIDVSRKPRLSGDNQKECPYVFKKGRNAGKICGVGVRRDGNCCSSHKKYDNVYSPDYVPPSRIPEVVVVEQCSYILTKGKNSGKICSKKAKRDGKYCASHQRKVSVAVPVIDADTSRHETPVKNQETLEAPSRQEVPVDMSRQETLEAPIIDIEAPFRQEVPEAVDVSRQETLEAPIIDIEIEAPVDAVIDIEVPVKKSRREAPIVSPRQEQELSCDSQMTISQPSFNEETTFPDANMFELDSDAQQRITQNVLNFDIYVAFPYRMNCWIHRETLIVVKQDQETRMFIATAIIEDIKNPELLELDEGDMLLIKQL